MCLIVFSYKNHPKFDLILAANRDEQQSRPTRAAQFWNQYPDLLAGKDLKAGGTWMGITKQGKFGALTNYRDATITKEDPPSRGQLILDYVNGSEHAEKYLKNLQPHAHQYMGFNLLAGTPGKLFHYSNQQNTFNRIEPGIHGLSNHLLDTPWPKVRKAAKRLRRIISSPFTPTDLFTLLRDDEQAPVDKLPETGFDQAMEQQASPIFIKSYQYGTRNSTVLLIDKKGNVTFEEQRFKTATDEVEEINRYEFTIQT